MNINLNSAPPMNIIYIYIKYLIQIILLTYANILRFLEEFHLNSLTRIISIFVSFWSRFVRSVWIRVICFNSPWFSKKICGTSKSKMAIEIELDNTKENRICKRIVYSFEIRIKREVKFTACSLTFWFVKCVLFVMQKIFIRRTSQYSNNKHRLDVENIRIGVGLNFIFRWYIVVLELYSVVFVYKIMTAL